MVHSIDLPLAKWALWFLKEESGSKNTKFIEKSNKKRKEMSQLSLEWY